MAFRRRWGKVAFCILPRCLFSRLARVMNGPPLSGRRLNRCLCCSSRKQRFLKCRKKIKKTRWDGPVPGIPISRTFRKAPRPLPAPKPLHVTRTKYKHLQPFAVHLLVFAGRGKSAVACVRFSSNLWPIVRGGSHGSSSGTPWAATF